MHFDQWIKNRYTAFNHALRRWINYKTVGLSLLALAIVMYGDVLLPAIGHSLHILFKIVEVAVGHFLEKTFDFTPRQAQFVVAYTTLALGIYVFIQLLRRAYSAAVRAWLAARALGLQASESAKTFWNKVSGVKSP